VLTPIKIYTLRWSFQCNYFSTLSIFISSINYNSHKMSVLKVDNRLNGSFYNPNVRFPCNGTKALNYKTLCKDSSDFWISNVVIKIIICESQWRMQINVGSRTDRSKRFFFKLEPISYFITIISYCVRVGKHNIFRYNLPKQANISIQ
jgi:hypothetical protein